MAAVSHLTRPRASERADGTGPPREPPRDSAGGPGRVDEAIAVRGAPSPLQGDVPKIVRASIGWRLLPTGASRGPDDRVSLSPPVSGGEATRLRRRVRFGAFARPGCRNPPARRTPGPRSVESPPMR